MAALKLILLSCLVAGLGYFAYRELQIDTFGFTINIHIPAKRSDIFQKLFDEPDFFAKVHPLCTGVRNIVRFKDKDGQRAIQFDIQQRMVLLAGLYDTGNFTFQMTVKEIEENTATQIMPLKAGMVQINQRFHLTDSVEGGTLVEDHAAYTAPRLLARLVRSYGHAVHTKINENILQYFIDISQQAIGEVTWSVMTRYDGFVMASVKFIVGSCSAVVLGYFTYRELQVDTLDFTLNKHIPAKRADVYRKFFHEPEFWLKVHPNCTGVTNVMRSQDQDGRRTVQFDMHEEGRFLGFNSKIQIQLTVKEMQENVSTHMSGSQLKGWFQFNQGFHLTDCKEGGTMLEDHCQYTAPRFLARYIRGVGLAQHTAITENTRIYFKEVSQDTRDS